MALIVSGIVIGVDQLTKSLAEAHLHRPVHVLGPFGLALGFNSGSAFSLFAGRGPILAVAALVLVGALVVMAWRARTGLTAVALGLILGGALGNVSDRVFRGRHAAVVDFITLTHWPTFNVADSAITVGVVLIIGATLRRPGAPPRVAS